MAAANTKLKLWRNPVTGGRNSMTDNIDISYLATEAKTWARSQKRVTNKAIRDYFNISEDLADVVYLYLKCEGIVHSMGYVY